MSHPDKSDPNYKLSSPASSVLRLAGLAAGIPILFLREELDAHVLVVFLTLFFFLGPYLVIGFASKKGMQPFQVGFAAGYALSMFVALVIYFVGRSFGSPISAAPVAAYGAGLLLNFALFTLAVITWIRQRKTIDGSTAFSMFMSGLGYPVLAFVILAIVGSAVLR